MKGRSGMKVVTYNIQYGIGLDGQFNLTRIADAVRGADVIALQEVTRNNPQNGGSDMVAELRTLLPEYFSVFGAPFSSDAGSRVENGRAIDLRLEFGNMVLSKRPIIASRNLLLPRQRSFGKLNLQRGAQEALIETPFGPVRFYSVHLDHTSPDERIEQIRFLMARVLGYPLEGGAVTGVSELGFDEPPHPDAFMLLGDFNMEPGSPEYVALTGTPDVEAGRPLRATRPADAAALTGSDGSDAYTWLDPQRPDDVSRRKRLDYGFVSAGIAHHVKAVRIDTGAVGSDHLPVWFELA